MEGSRLQLYECVVVMVVMVVMVVVTFRLTLHKSNGFGRV